ncbi:MAG: hypothetical protein FJX75_25660 [Armatimonadetes bacterium]|nr:hypothetical protein [Armatimonadota bacterium]
MPFAAPPWEPTDPLAWASALGLAHVRLLPFGRQKEWAGACSVLLDGRDSSFAFCSTAGNASPHDPRPLEWAWSANLRHLLMVDPTQNELLLRSCDEPAHYRRFTPPPAAPDAEGLLRVMAHRPPARDDDVVSQMLRAFRRVRSILPGRDEMSAIAAFNALLLATEGVQLGVIPRECWETCRTLGDALDVLADWPSAVEDSGATRIPSRLRTAPLGTLPGFLLRPDPRARFSLHPDLLLRHAAGQLYQEVHLIVERDPDGVLPGLGPDAPPRGRLAKDVRFTPAPLARSLAEQALELLRLGGALPPELDILDPACGSGVFLIEALRLLQGIGYRGCVRLRGFDRSPLSCLVARFCLARAARDAIGTDLDVKPDITQCDALTTDWGRPDAILMNPPFVPWQGMTPEERGAIASVLGELTRGRADKAMAFAWKAASTLAEGGVLATVLPSALLETDAGVAWREALARRAELRTIGRLQGYAFFTASTVEPSFVVLRRPRPGDLPERVTILVSRQWREGEAIRALRRRAESSPRPGVEQPWEVFQVDPMSLTPATWLPRTRHDAYVTELLERSGLPVVAELFDVHQGIRTGCNEAFVLSDAQVENLPPAERGYFRPAATNRTIRDGALLRGVHVFYPYGADGLRLGTEPAVEEAVPVYYAAHLLPHKPTLAGRRRAHAGKWWVLSEDRAWLRPRVPKLVTKYFGRSGGFAYDADGEFVVLQAHAWLPRRQRGDSRALAGDTSGWRGEPVVAWAYVALLNSSQFEQLLSAFCPRMLGGQFNLSRRFVGRIPIPDLSDDLSVPHDVVHHLADLGRRLAQGQTPARDEVDEAARLAYGVGHSRAR